MGAARQSLRRGAVIFVRCLDRLRRQLSDLEWLLDQCRFDIERWKVKLAAEKEEGKLTLVLFLSRQGRKIVLMAVSDPEEAASHGIGQRHFWIDGNHWYDGHAVEVLTSELCPSKSEKRVLRLCELAEEAAQQGKLGDPSELLRAARKVRKSLCRTE